MLEHVSSCRHLTGTSTSVCSRVTSAVLRLGQERHEWEGQPKQMALHSHPSQRQDLPHNLWNSKIHVILVRAWGALKDTRKWCQNNYTHKKKHWTVNTGTINSHGIIMLYSKVTSRQSSLWKVNTRNNWEKWLQMAMVCFWVEKQYEGVEDWDEDRAEDVFV